MAAIDCDLLEKLIRQGRTIPQVAKRLGCTERSARRAVRRLGLRAGRHPGKAMIDPTPEEIVKRSAEVRAKRVEKAERHDPVEVKQFAYNRRTGVFTGLG